MSGKIDGSQGVPSGPPPQNLSETTKKTVSGGRAYSRAVDDTANKSKFFFRDSLSKLKTSIKNARRKVSNDLLILSFPIKTTEKTTEKTHDKANDIIMSVHRTPRGTEINKLRNLKITDVDKAIEKLFKKFPNSEATISLVEKALLQDVENSDIKDPGTLLRENSVSSKLLKAFILKYLKPILSGDFKKILTEIPKEKSERKVDNDLAITIAKELVSISGSSGDKNFQLFKTLCKSVGEATSNKFGEAAGKAVASNLFILRFTNPAMINPATYIDSGSKYEGGQLRNAISASKIVQTTVNKPSSYKPEENVLLEALIDKIAENLLS